jgi:hypothetical protein
MRSACVLTDSTTWVPKPLVGDCLGHDSAELLDRGARPTWLSRWSWRKKKEFCTQLNQAGESANDLSEGRAAEIAVDRCGPKSCE